MAGWEPWAMRLRGHLLAQPDLTSALIGITRDSVITLAREMGYSLAQGYFFCHPTTYGTGAFLLLHTGAARPAGGGGLLTTVACDAHGGAAYALEASIFIAGAAVQWLRDGLGLVARASETEAMARGVASTDGVYFVPALTGLGAPAWEPNARGTIVGLTRGTTKQHLVRAALEAIKGFGEHFDVLHAHDQQASWAPCFVRTHDAEDAAFQGTATVFTIHNLGYQGIVDPWILGLAGFPRSAFHLNSPFEYHGRVNFMKVGILFRTEINLTYARIQDIHLRSGIIQRWLGIADVQVQTASGSSGPELVIEGFKEFEQIRDFLYTRMRGYQQPAAAQTAPATGVETGKEPAVEEIPTFSIGDLLLRVAAIVGPLMTGPIGELLAQAK